MPDTLTVVFEIDVTDDSEAALRRLVHLVESMHPHGSNPVREFLIEQWGWRYGPIEDVVGTNSKVFHSPPPVLRLGPAGDVIIDVLDFDYRSGTWKLLLGDGRIVQTDLTGAQPGLYGPLMAWRKRKHDHHMSELYSVWFEQGYNDMDLGVQKDPKSILNDLPDLKGDECAAVYNGYRNGQADWKSENEPAQATAHDEGYSAGFLGNMKQSDNPYPPSDPRHDKWAEGCTKGQHDLIMGTRRNQ